MGSAFCKRCHLPFPTTGPGPATGRELLCPGCRERLAILDRRGLTGASPTARRRMTDMTEPELRDMFEELAREIQQRMPAGPGKFGEALFCLVVFDDPGVGQYVSNANRAGCIKSMREFADHLEQRTTIDR